MKRSFYLTLVLLCTLTSWTHAQRLTKGAGVGFFSMQLPEAYLERKSTVQGIPDDSLLRPANWSFGFGINYSFLYRVYTINNDNSLMISASPMLGIQFTTNNLDTDMGVFGDYGLPLVVQLPLMLQYANGMVSTNESDRDHGFAFGLGVETTWYHDRWRYANPNDPLSSYSNFFTDNRFIAAPSLLVRPVAAISWRTWSKSNYPLDFSLQYSTSNQTYDLGTANRGMIRFSFTSFWNY